MHRRFGQDGSAMTTGVWSKRIKEANGPNGPSNAMAWVGVVLVGVMGLGFQVKIRALRMFMAEAYEFFGNNYRQRVRQGMEAERRYAARHGRGFEYSRNYEQERANFDRQRAQFHHEQQQRRADFASGSLHASRELLGVRAGCSRSELKAAYYALAKQHHPDSATTAGADFARLKDAYDELLPHAPR